MGARRFHITGVVQGVGFRPFVWGLADRLGLTGWVRNDAAGVNLVVEGGAAALDDFRRGLREEAPPLAEIDRIEETPAESEGRADFVIVHSEDQDGAYLPVAADVATCDDCLRELADPADRRHRYPFLNCTNCGPRYTIVRNIPYDRPQTTLADFELCADCAAEYEDPSDRRFHAQPVACPACGPRIWLEEEGRRVAEDEAALLRLREHLAAGKVAAIKGLGGFHLACDATNTKAVSVLRERKRRQGKPFALMAADLDTVRRHAEVGEAEAELLASAARPVVLLPRRPESPVAAEVAPDRHNLGFMLPYTPLHHLLLESAPDFPEVLVMTSANLSEEPIAYRNDEGRERLAELADVFLLHDRPIHIRCDDSVASSFRGHPYFFRRSRGYAPLPVDLPVSGEDQLAVGGELKNVFCLTRDDRAFLGHHIGDLEYAVTLRAFEEGIDHIERLFRVEPRRIVHDLHPDYQCTRYALDRAAREGLELVGVQHHHAHVAACMADNGLGPEARVIGVAFDGVGYGPDGTAWGGEFLIAGYDDYERPLHLAPGVLPGGDAAVRNPYRLALAWLRQAGIDWDDDLPPAAVAGEEELTILAQQLAGAVNTPATTSMGRLFDAVAALIGLAPRISYEAQAACELESIADPRETGAYDFTIADGLANPADVVAAVVADLRRGETPATIAARFHNGVARLVGRACAGLRDGGGPATVALSGGVWQNMLLLHRSVDELERRGFDVLVHRRVPASDGGLALGQAAVAAVRARRRQG